MQWGADKVARINSTEAGENERSPEDEKLDKLKFERDIAGLIKEGKLSPGTGLYDTPDEAAIAVLDVIAPLSGDYQLEVSGHIYQEGEKWAYTRPVVGGPGSAPLATTHIGYHTHPNGSLTFSNSGNNHSGNLNGGDAKWVQASGKDLYVGIRINNKVSIGVCSPGACPDLVRPTLHNQNPGTPPTRILR